ncbi:MULTISPECIES: ABC transporter permease [Ignavibacterium]|jgi:lipoprotein-releasing system permease protein|uniref:ABC transporter permease n=1 Tax=Ignavibacterium TaxID=795750 RepID=UPI0025BFD4BD|nr:MULTISPECIES: ABC transporter permease [Ignavibacterium]MBI5661449.1 ABC transporter permease [Ignavibacterium album]
MELEKFIAKRYLISRHKLNFITIISFLSISGITIGVAALIVVLSVFNGFGSLVTSYLMSLDPNLRIVYKIESNDKLHYETEKRIKSVSEIKSYSPFVSGKVLALNRGKTEIINLRAVELDNINQLYDFDNLTLTSILNLKKATDDAIYIGIRLADKLEAVTGDTITIVSPSNIENILVQGTPPSAKKFVIAAIFNSQNNEYDESLAITDLSIGQKLLGFRNSFEGYEIKLKDSNKSDEIKKELTELFDKNLVEINTWYDFHKELYSVMQIERWVAYILLSLIIAVASFNILGSLSMSVLEKKRDIGIMKSFGVTENSILKIFLNEGILIGIFGTMFGVIIGYFVCWLQINYNIYPLDPTMYKIDSLPLEIRVSDFFFVAGASMLLTFLAALFPARRAAKVDALQSIKWE